MVKPWDGVAWSGWRVCGVASEVLEISSSKNLSLLQQLHEMAAIMGPQAPQSLNEHEELHKLNLKLDDLFERYLNLIDQYQAARKQLSTELSSVRYHFIACVERKKTSLTTNKGLLFVGPSKLQFEFTATIWTGFLR